PTVARDGSVYFADYSADRIYRADPQGKVVQFHANTGGAAALRAGPDGLLYASQPARHRIVSYTAAGEEKVVAQKVDATDLAVRADRAVFFTDARQGTIGFVDPAGKMKIAYKGGEIAVPSGIALSPDQGMLHVTDAQSRFSWSFAI